MKKKLTLSIVLLVALAVIMSLTIFVSNIKAETLSAVVDEITYNYQINEDGETVTITDITLPGGNGTDVTTEVPHLKIPSTLGENNLTVTVIGDRALNFGSSNTRVKALTIPNTVTEIGIFAFGNNRAITALEIPDSVTAIKEDAFAKLEGLKTLTIGKNITSIGERAFGRTKSLTSISIKEGNNDFFKVENNCLIDVKNAKVLTAYAETSIEVPEGVKMIGEQAFYNSVVTSISLPSTLETIGAEAFYNGKLTTISIPTSVTAIGASAFCGCTALTDLTIEAGSDGLTIGKAAFNGCTSLAKVEDKGSILSIGDEAFLKCTGIKTLILGDKVKSIGVKAFYDIEIVTINLGNSVETIADYAFYNNDTITSIEIPATVKTIGERAIASASKLSSVTFKVDENGSAALTTIGKEAFYNNTATAGALSLPKNVLTIGEGAFYNSSKITSVTLGNSVQTIGVNAFYNCDALTSINIPASVKTVGAGAFQTCAVLSSIIVPDGVTEIGANSFKNTGLTSVSIPASVKTVGDSAFAGTKLANVWFSGTADDKANITVGASNEKLTDATWNYINCIYSTNTEHDHGYTYNCECICTFCEKITRDVDHKYIDGKCDYCEEACPFEYEVNDDKITITGYTGNAATIKIPSKIDDKDVTAIGDDAFNSGKETTTVAVIIPNTVTTIGARAFDNKRGIIELVIPDSVLTIEEEAFYRLRGLKSLKIGTGVTTMGDRAFGYNAVLEEINADGNSNFEVVNGCLIDKTDINNKKIITAVNASTTTIPNDVKIIGDYAFYAHSNLTGVFVIPVGVEEIGVQAFDSTGISGIVIPKSVTTIYNGAFANTAELKKTTGQVYYEGTKAEYDGEIITWIRNDDGDTQNKNITNEVTTRSTKYYNACMGRETYTTEAYGHEYGALINNVSKCSSCTSSIELKFKSAAPVLQNNLSIIYRVDTKLFDLGLITATPSVTFTMGEKTQTVVGVLENGVYNFTFTDIAPNKLGDEISATLTVGEHTVTMDNYSIVRYCTNMRGTSDELDTLLDALLNYGSAAQIHTNYKADATANLANPDYDASALVAPTMDAAASLTAMAEGATEKAEWKSATLILEDAITMRFKFALNTEQTNGTLSVLVNGTAVATENIVANTDGTYYVYYNGVDANEMGDAVTVVVKDGDDEVSKTLNYSVEAYAVRKIDEYNDLETKTEQDDKLYNLVVAMMLYGDAAVAYAG